MADMLRRIMYYFKNYYYFTTILFILVSSSAIYSKTEVLYPAIVMGVDASVVSLRTLRSAAIIITIIPILCVYPFLQKYFAKGIMIGAIKG